MTAPPHGTHPALRVHDNPPLDVTAIDNLPSLLPVESSEDYRRPAVALASDAWRSVRRRLGRGPEATFDNQEGDLSHDNPLVRHRPVGGARSAPPDRERPRRHGLEPDAGQGARTRSAISPTTSTPLTSTRWRTVLQPGDVVVSMLPGDWHVPLAELAIAKGAHFVVSSYIAPEMRALDDQARRRRRGAGQRGRA